MGRMQGNGARSPAHLPLYTCTDNRTLTINLINATVPWTGGGQILQDEITLGNGISSGRRRAMRGNQSAQNNPPDNMSPTSQSECAYREWITLLIHDVFSVLEDGYAQVAAGRPVMEIKGQVLEQMAQSLIRRSARSAGPVTATDGAGSDCCSKLTPSQQEILTRISRSGDSAMVARELGISVKTVRTHVRNACSRLQVSGRTAAIQKARALGLIP